MIPQRVKLSGFLSYREEQEVCFDGSQLWMLCGVNGSGKSSIFDAVTFALFGHHRGGRVDAVELINKEANTLSVEFEFSLDGQRYCIKRTVRRRPSGITSTQQVLEYTTASAEAPARWNAVFDTQYKAKFDVWVKDKIGLDYETFTSSVLLLQGKAEKLLDSTPSGRAGVLARIVDLERYQTLHAAADEKRKETKAAVDALAAQLTATKEVTEDEYTAAAAAIVAAEHARTAAHKRVDELHALEIQARRYAEAAARVEVSRAKLRNSEALLGQQVVIEKAFARFRELREVLPAVQLVVTERGRLGESERHTERLTRDHETTLDRKRKTENALELARRKLADLKKTLAENETRQAACNHRLRELAAALEQVRQAEDTRAEVQRLEAELQRLPTDPEAAVTALQAEAARLADLGRVVLLLDRLRADRAGLLETALREADGRKRETQLKVDGLKARKEHEKAETDLAAARVFREAADKAAAEAGALATESARLAAALDTLEGSKICRNCGQPLTPEHYAEERRKRTRDAKAARLKADETAAAAAAAREAEDDLTRQETTARKKRDDLRELYKDALGEMKRAATEVERLAAACRDAYHALPTDYRLRVSPTPPTDWSAAPFPTDAEYVQLQAESTRAGQVSRDLQAAQRAANESRTVRAKLDSARDRLGKLPAGLSVADAAAVREEQIAKHAEETTTVAQIKAAKKEIVTTETELDRHQRSLGEIDRGLVEIVGKLNLEESVRKQSREAIDRARSGLSVEWQERVSNAGLGEQLKWREEAETLAAQDIEAQYTRLQAARGGLESLRAEIQLLDEEVNAFPESARQPADAVHGQVMAARQEADSLGRELLAAERRRDTLDELRVRRADLNERRLAADQIYARYKILAELLGRDRLQRHLVRRAEAQIIDFANAVLDRLSRGELFLRLVGAEELPGLDKALDLEASNQLTGGSPINVAFLSGSQRFRVAVALALGIGQYASKQHRPIESVIIDEGFGCLDRAGRQVMIQELQNLRGHLRRILLVSHQEEFADAFPDGYRFELVDGGTRVSRYRR